jgi:pentatricopeptide repeat protein
MITPRLDHYTSMVDLLGRAGKLHEARDFIKKMPLEPTARIWGSLLAAYKIYGNIVMGQDVAENLFNLEPENARNYVLLSNIYAAAGRWDDVVKVRTMMKYKGLKKTLGCSFIDVDNTVHTFLVGDRSHPQSEEIYATMEILVRKMEEVGYVPNKNFVLHDVEEEVK